MNRADAFLLFVDERPPTVVMRYLVTWRDEAGEHDWSQYDRHADAVWKVAQLDGDDIAARVHDLDAEVAAADSPLFCTCTCDACGDGIIECACEDLEAEHECTCGGES